MNNSLATGTSKMLSEKSQLNRLTSRSLILVISPRSNGVTLVELVLVVAVLAILAIVGIPTGQSLLAKQRFVSAVEATHAHLNLAKTEAAKRSTMIHLAIAASGSTWSIGIGDSTDCSAADLSACTLTFYDPNTGAPLGETKTTLLSSTQHPKISLSTNHNAIRIEPVRGTILDSTGTAADLQLTISSENATYESRIGLKPTGYLYICSPDSSKALGRYSEACN
jgi:type IV fimbrial biogenesis protein FimT